MRRTAPNKASSPKNSQQGENHITQKEKQIESKTVSKTNFGGLVLLEKVNENLESLLKAFKGRIAAETILPRNLQEYPNPIQEGHRLTNHMWLVKDTQTQWEAPTTMITCILHMSKSLETIDENHFLCV